MQKPIKLTPHYAHYIWGGNKLEESYGKSAKGQKIAESWELSTHKDGKSRVNNQGKEEQLDDYLAQLSEKLGYNPLGSKAKTKPGELPILVKFIDARNDLSIQVHPHDEYSMQHENDSGKTETWFVMESEPNSFIYLGLKKNATKKKVAEKIKNEQLESILNKVYVKKGDVYHLPAGTIHAIGSGLVICEVQQSSNATYRLYDYGRKDTQGNKRPLHIDKALDVAILEPQIIDSKPQDKVEADSDTKISLLSSCDYFNIYFYKLVEAEKEIQTTYESFVTIVCTEGSGEIMASDEIFYMKKGESYFIPAGDTIYQIKGTCEFLKITL